MSDTPRTDEQEKWDDCEGGIRDARDGWLIATDFARKLERELAAMTAAKNKAVEALRDCVKERGHVGWCCVNYNNADEKFCNCGLDEYQKLLIELEEVK